MWVCVIKWVCASVSGVLVHTLLSKSEVLTQVLMTYSSESTSPSQERIYFLASSPAELRFLCQHKMPAQSFTNRITALIWFISREFHFEVMENTYNTGCTYNHNYTLCITLFSQKYKFTHTFCSHIITAQDSSKGKPWKTNFRLFRLDEWWKKKVNRWIFLQGHNIMCPHRKNLWCERRNIQSIKPSKKTNHPLSNGGPIRQNKSDD